METFIKDLRRILDEYEAREKQKTEVLTGTVKFTNLGSLVGDSRPSERLVFHTNGECVMNISDGLKSFQQSLQDVNAAGQLSSGVEELSPYIEHILNTNEELKKRLEEKNREIDELRTSHEDPRVISEITKLKIRLGEEEDKRKKVEADLENAVRKIEMKDQKIKELARDYNQMLDLKDRWEAMVICRPHPDDQLRRQIKIYEDLIADKNKRIEELEGNLDLSIISASSPNKLVEEYEQLVRRQNKLISDLRDQIKGECKVDRFEASIEKLNEIVGILDQWRNNDCRNRQKAVKSESGGETGQVIA